MIAFVYRHPLNSGDSCSLPRTCASTRSVEPSLLCGLLAHVDFRRLAMQFAVCPQ